MEEREMDTVMKRAIDQLRDLTASCEIEIYNEASVKYELAYLLRKILGKSWKIYLERNVEDFGLRKKNFLKKEMDISLVEGKDGSHHCIELKYPRSGQYPEQMFKVCEDIRFLEQLREAGFGRCYFLMFCDDSNFFRPVGGSQIYDLFRRKRKLYGRVLKPTGRKNRVVDLDGTYIIDWKELKGELKYFFVRV